MISSTTLKDYILTLGRQARQASNILSAVPEKEKNSALLKMAQSLEESSRALLLENEKDVALAYEKGISEALIDRLKLTPERIASMAEGLRKVTALKDPTGQIMDQWSRPNGIRITQVRVPIGVIGMIYESRPNVTADASALCLKAGNTVILKGGSDAMHSNKAIAKCLQGALVSSGLPEHAIQLVETIDREAVVELCHMDQYLDLIIPRGGKSLIQTVVQNARMPVIKHYDGICHLYVDEQADLNMAVDIADDGKTQRPGACNALETLLVHERIAPRFLPLLSDRMKSRGVLLKADAEALAYLGKEAQPATDEDWSTEYLDLVLSIKTVHSLDDAIHHINHYGSHHSDAIVTTSDSTASAFLSQIQSACVYHNASTRFSDGEEFGFGAEIGISTDKLHARGPMGLKELTSYQYRVTGSGQVKDSSRLL